MGEILGEVFDLLSHIGMLVWSIVIAAGLTYVISLWLWSEFNVGLFATLAVPFAVIGLYIEHKMK